RIINGDKLRAGKFLRIITVLSIASALCLSPLSPLTYGIHLSPAYEKPVEVPRIQYLRQIVSLVPPNASVLTQDNLFPHFSNRLDAYVMVPSTYKDVKTWKDTINWLNGLTPEYVLMDLETDPHNTIKYAFSIVQKGNYRLLAFYDNIYLYKRNYTGAVIRYEPINQIYTYNNLIIQNMKPTPDPTSSTGTALVYHNNSIQTRTLWYGPYDIVPKGNYTVTYMVKTKDPNLNETIRLDVFYNETTLNQVNITDSMLGADAWTPICLNITLNAVAYNLEFRGILIGENTTLVLDFIRLAERP
ncbi:MAG: DUF2079 domain-containing protein, partial [Armatimonadetes bacterium]|nr:DUF2079 domain-containing protein [Armatimonadota bacterium]